MTEERTHKSGVYSSMLGFLMMAIGYAVGAGAIWRFPYMIGVNGGGAFMIIIIAMTFIVGITFVLGELVIGRTTHSTCIVAYYKLEGKKSMWKMAGWFGVIGGFGLMTYYISITGTALYYVVESVLKKGFTGMTREGTADVYNGLINNVTETTAFVALTLVLIAIVLFKGVSGGFEKLAKIALPVLFVCIMICTIYSLTLPEAGYAVKWLFTPDWSKVTGKTLLDCLSQVLFTAGLGMSAVYAFGSNLGEGSSLTQTSVTMSMANLVLAILAGIAIFSAVFTFGLDPESGSSLVFITMPMLFGKMGFGGILAFCFFTCFFLASFMTSMGIVEGIAAALSDVYNVGKKKMLVIVVIALTICSIIPTLAQTPVLADVRILGMDVYTFIDFIVCSVIIPFDVLLTMIYCGYKFAFKRFVEEANKGAKYLRLNTGIIWKFIVRILCPASIVLVLIVGITNVLI